MSCPVFLKRPVHVLRLAVLVFGAGLSGLGLPGGALAGPAQERLDFLSNQARQTSLPNEVRAQAAYEAGILMLSHPDVKDPEAAAKWLLKAGDLGNVQGTFVAGVSYLRGENGFEARPQTGIALIKDASAKGHTEARYLYAHMVAGGFSQRDTQLVERDEAKGFALMKKAASFWGCYPSANIELAQMYLNGTGTEVDALKAVEQFENAMGNGELQAAHFLMAAYRDTPAVKKAVDDQIRRYTDAYEAKAEPHDDWPFRLGLLTWLGIGVEKDVQKANRIWSENLSRADGYVAVPTLFLSAMLAAGQGTEESTKKARGILYQLQSYFQSSGYSTKPGAYHWGLFQLAQKLGPQPQ